MKVLYGGLVSKVYLEGKETNPENLPNGFFQHRIDKQTQFAVPRITREEVNKVIRRAKKAVHLIEANLSFDTIYKKPETSKEEELAEREPKPALPNVQARGPGIPPYGPSHHKLIFGGM